MESRRLKLARFRPIPQSKPLLVQQPMENQPAVSQLVYSSCATEEFLEPDLALLLVKARANNDALNITGALLYQAGSFIQALEGPQDALDKLFRVISNDQRHEAIHELYRGEVAKREFANWSMGFCPCTQSDGQNLHDFKRFLRAGSRRTLNEASGSARKTLLAFNEQQWHRSRVAVAASQPGCATISRRLRG